MKSYMEIDKHGTKRYKNNKGQLHNENMDMLLYGQMDIKHIGLPVIFVKIIKGGG